MTTPAFIPTTFRQDGAAVTVVETPTGTFHLLVRRDGCERVRQISKDLAHLHREAKSLDVETDIDEMRAELVHAIRQNEAEAAVVRYGRRTSAVQHLMSWTPVVPRTRNQPRP